MHFLIFGAFFMLTSSTIVTDVMKLESFLVYDEPEPVPVTSSTKQSTQTDQWDVTVVDSTTGMVVEDNFVTNPRLLNNTLNDSDSMSIPAQEGVASAFDSWPLDINDGGAKPSLPADYTQDKRLDSTLSNDMDMSISDDNQEAQDADCTISSLKQPPAIPTTPTPTASCNNTESCQTTMSGCDCQNNWVYTHKGVTTSYSGCANPDEDLFSTWCVVEPSCPLDARHGNIENESGESVPFGRCSADCDLERQPSSSQGTIGGVCYRTVAECTCKRQWSYDGRQVGGCNNPDGDPLGDWCEVVAGSCLREVMGGVFVNQITNETQGEELWDYCKKDCS